MISSLTTNVNLPAFQASLILPTCPPSTIDNKDVGIKNGAHVLPSPHELLLRYPFL